MPVLCCIFVGSLHVSPGHIYSSLDRCGRLLKMDRRRSLMQPTTATLGQARRCGKGGPRQSMGVGGKGKPRSSMNPSSSSSGMGAYHPPFIAYAKPVPPPSSSSFRPPLPIAPPEAPPVVFEEEEQKHQQEEEEEETTCPVLKMRGSVSQVETVLEQMQSLLSGAISTPAREEAQVLGERLVTVTTQALSHMRDLMDSCATTTSTNTTTATAVAATLRPEDAQQEGQGSWKEGALSDITNIVQEVDDLLSSPVPEVVVPPLQQQLQGDIDENGCPTTAGGESSIAAAAYGEPPARSTTTPPPPAVPRQHVDDMNSPPGMDKLGLSHATRRLIMNNTNSISYSKDVNASSSSTPPVSRPAPTGGYSGKGDDLSVMSTPKASVDPNSEAHFPSPIFRTGVKLKPPSTGMRGGGGGGPSSASRCMTSGSHPSPSSSSLSSLDPSPPLFEPRSVDRRGIRRSLLPPRATTAEQPPHDKAVGGGLSSSFRSSLSTLGGSSPAASIASSSLSHITTRRATTSTSRGGGRRSSSSSALRAGEHKDLLLMTTTNEDEDDESLLQGVDDAAMALGRAPPSTMGTTTRDVPATPMLSSGPRVLSFPGSADHHTQHHQSAPSPPLHPQATGSSLLDDSAFLYPDLTSSHDSSFHFSRAEQHNLQQQQPPATPPVFSSSPLHAPLPPTSPYNLRSLTKSPASKSRTSATEPSQPQQQLTPGGRTRGGGSRAAPGREGGTTPKQRGGRSGACSASKSPRSVGTRKSPRFAPAAVAAKEEEGQGQGGGPMMMHKVDGEKRRSMRLGMDMEEEDEEEGGAAPRHHQPTSDKAAPAAPASQGGGGGSKVVKGPVEVGEDEYKQAPTFIRMQVSREVLNEAIASLNAYLVTTTTSGTRQDGPAAQPLEPLLMEKVVGVIGLGERSRTVLLSLIHLKRIDMSMGRNSLRTYRWWK